MIPCRRFIKLFTLFLPLLFVPSSSAQSLLGEEPALGDLEHRTTQADIEFGGLSLVEIRRRGLDIFATPFRRADGFGDGALNYPDKITPGGRPALQNNGTFLLVNGLDGQSCLDCHAVVSADTVPATFGIGGAGGINDSAMFMTRAIDAEDIQGNGFAAFDGRLINPPALFGTGLVQLLGKEMTQRLQRLKARALANPGETVSLNVKGVNFGSIVASQAGELDTSGVEGIDEDLVVRPFGRKGEFSSVRAFDLGALMFHFGMQPIELVGELVDDDQDGVVNEILTGEVSALEIFVTTQETPMQLRLGEEERRGLKKFKAIGCADCHRPTLNTRSSNIDFSFPEIETDRSANIFYSADLTKAPSAAKMKNNRIKVALFSDLKRHDMGDTLKENFHAATPKQNREFITAKLWGVADTAPYLHDGRALTLNEAIMLHGGEAADAQSNYSQLSAEQKNQLLAFLRTLRNPKNPNADVSKKQ